MCREEKKGAGFMLGDSADGSFTFWRTLKDAHVVATLSSGHGNLIISIISIFIVVVSHIF